MAYCQFSHTQLLEAVTLEKTDLQIPCGITVLSGSFKDGVLFDKLCFNVTSCVSDSRDNG
jgi:hypothetical protein